MTTSLQDRLQSFRDRSGRIMERLEKTAFRSLAETSLPAADLGTIVLAEGTVVVGGASRRLGTTQKRGELSTHLSHGGVASPAETADAVERYVARMDFNPGVWVLALPKLWYITRIVELPGAVTDDDIPRVLRYEMDRLVPLSPDSALFDFSVIARDETLRLFMVAGNRGKIIPYIDELKGRGFPVVSVAPSLLGWASACRPGGIRGNDAIVDLSPDRPELLHVRGENDFVFITLDPPEPDTESWLQRLPVPQADVLWAGYGTLAGSRVNTLAPTVSAHAAHVLADGGETTTAAERSGGAAEALAAGRLQRRNDIPAIDLLRSERREGKASRGLGLSAVLTLMLVGLFGMGTFLPIRNARARLEAINEQITAVQTEVESVQKLEQRLDSILEEGDVLYRFKQRESPKLLILRELSETIPENTWFNQLSMKGDAVDLGGYSDTATDLLGLLERSEILRQVEFSSPTVRDRRSNADRFKIKARVEGTSYDTP